MENQRDFCTECRRETNYTLKKIKINQTIREKEYTFEITAAFCSECGGEMGIPGLTFMSCSAKLPIYSLFRMLRYNFNLISGGEMGIPGLIDYNMKEIDEQYRSIRT